MTANKTVTVWAKHLSASERKCIQVHVSSFIAMDYWVLRYHEKDVNPGK